MPSNILIVDDSPLLAELGAEILKETGAAVDICTTAADALERIATGHYDLLVTDLDVGGQGNGFLLAGAMKTRRPAAATLLLTGYPDYESAWRAIQASVDLVMLKPAEPARFRQVVQRITAGEPLRWGNMGLGDVIEANCQELMEDWLQRVEADALVASVPLAREERTDDLENMVNAIAERIRRPGRAMDEARWESAKRHGEMRRRQSYSVKAMLREASALRESITEMGLNHFLDLDPKQLLPDMVEMNAAIDEGMGFSLEAYLQAGGAGA